MGSTVHFHQSSCDTPKLQMVHSVNYCTEFIMETFILSKCHVVSRHTGKCNFIYTSKKNPDLPCADFYETHES